MRSWIWPASHVMTHVPAMMNDTRYTRVTAWLLAHNSCPQMPVLATCYAHLGHNTLDGLTQCCCSHDCVTAAKAGAPQQQPLSINDAGQLWSTNVCNCVCPVSQVTGG